MSLVISGSGGMADAADLKSADREVVRVRVPSPRPLRLSSLNNRLSVEDKSYAYLANKCESGSVQPPNNLVGLV